MTKEQARQIIAAVGEGRGTKATADSLEISVFNFFKTIARDPELSAEYLHAQAARAEILAEEIIDISDQDLDPQRARVRCDARRWYASKMQPAKFGDRIDVNVTQTVDISGALGEARQRTRAIEAVCQPAVSAPQNIPPQLVKNTEEQPAVSRDTVSLQDDDIFS